MERDGFRLPVDNADFVLITRQAKPIERIELASYSAIENGLPCMPGQREHREVSSEKSDPVIPGDQGSETARGIAVGVLLGAMCWVLIGIFGYLIAM